MPYQERQLSSSRNDPDYDRDCRDGEEDSANDAALRADEKREIEDGPDENKSPNVDVEADVVFCSIAPFADEPRGNEKERKCLLSLVAGGAPIRKRSDRPHENGRGPVLLDVEDLSNKCDRCAGCDWCQQRGAWSMSRDIVACDGSPKVEDGDHGHDEEIAHAGPS